jgi:hypothetical protein
MTLGEFRGASLWLRFRAFDDRSSGGGCQVSLGIHID